MISDIFTVSFLSNRSSKLRIYIEAIIKERKKGKMNYLTVKPFILPLFRSLVIAYMYRIFRVNHTCDSLDDVYVIPHVNHECYLRVLLTYRDIAKAKVFIKINVRLNLIF